MISQPDFKYISLKMFSFISYISHDAPDPAPLSHFRSHCGSEAIKKIIAHPCDVLLSLGCLFSLVYCETCSCVGTPSVQCTLFRVYRHCWVLGEDVYTDAIFQIVLSVYLQLAGGKTWSWSYKWGNDLDVTAESKRVCLLPSFIVLRLGGDPSLAAESWKQEGQVTTDHILCQNAKEGDARQFIFSLWASWAGRSIISTFEPSKKNSNLMQSLDLKTISQK